MDPLVLIFAPIRTNAILGEERKMNNDRPFPLYYSGLNALAVTQALFSGRFQFNYYEIENRRVVTANSALRPE